MLKKILEEAKALKLAGVYPTAMFAFEFPNWISLRELSKKI
jgi:hypothetical protein